MLKTTAKMKTHMLNMKTI